MGLFNFLKGAIGSSKSVSIDTSLGNVLICGNSKQGAEVIMRNYAIDSVNKGYGLVVFRDQINGVASYPTITTSNSMIYSIDCAENTTTDQIDIFSGMSETDINNYIIKIFDMYNEIEKSRKMGYLNYIALMRSLAAKAGKKIRLDQFVNYSIEEVEDLNLRFCKNPMEQSRNDRFLTSIRADIRELEAYLYDFSQNVIGNVLSGTKSLEKILSLKPIVEISLDFSSKPLESKIIMVAIIDAINRCNFTLAGKSGVNVIVDGAPNDILIESGIQKLIKSGRAFNVVYTIQDISNLLEQSNEWIDYADSYFFFKQTSNKNKEFCSEFFGTYEKQKETITQGKNTPTFWSRLSGQGGGTTVNSGKTITTEKERVYLPEVFAGLPANQAIYYLKKTNTHTYLTVF